MQFYFNQPDHSKCSTFTHSHTVGKDFCEEFHLRIRSLNHLHMHSHTDSTASGISFLIKNTEIYTSGGMNHHFFPRQPFKVTLCRLQITGNAVLVWLSVPFFSGWGQKLVLQAWDIDGLRWRAQPGEGFPPTRHWTVRACTPPPHVTVHCRAQRTHTLMLDTVNTMNPLLTKVIGSSCQLFTNIHHTLSLCTWDQGDEYHSARDGGWGRGWGG